MKIKYNAEFFCSSSLNYREMKDKERVIANMCQNYDISDLHMEYMVQSFKQFYLRKISGNHILFNAKKAKTMASQGVQKYYI